MDSRKVAFLIFVFAFAGIAALTATNRASNRRVSLFDSATYAPAAPTLPTPPKAKPKATAATASPTPQPTAAPTLSQNTKPPPTTEPANNSKTPVDFTDTSRDLRGSQTLLNTIDETTQYADDAFSTPAVAGDPGSWTVNQQGMDQLDYRTDDGLITKWFETDERGDGVTRAEEAQMNNGELIDRWYRKDGSVEQVMHQYDNRNSYAVYYYASGEIEATRVVRDGNEIFTKYDKDGRELQRTYTPAGD